jgi:antitoxin component YwqK of YwqJK toxin-antitoxin module
MKNKIDRFIKDGYFETFHLNGKSRIKGFIRDGLREGTWTFYNSEGGINVIQNYKNNFLDGERRVYNDGGGLFRITNYKNGVPSGLESHYRNNILYMKNYHLI